MGKVMASRSHPELGFRSCLGILRLAQRYDPQRLENACQRALGIQGYQQENGDVGEVQADLVLVALGRRPDLEELALDKAGVNCSPRGIIADKTLRTSASNIYACGDIVGPDQLASMAEYEGIVAATNAVLPVKQRVDYRNSVYVIFTEPTLAFLGLTEAQAHAKHGHKLKVYRFDYASMRRALIDGATTGLAKVLCDGRGRLIGAHRLGEAAAEVIHEAQVIRALKKPLKKLNLVTHAYPTYSQALVHGADANDRGKWGRSPLFVAVDSGCQKTSSGS